MRMRLTHALLQLALLNRAGVDVAPFVDVSVRFNLSIVHLSSSFIAQLHCILPSDFYI